MEKNGIDLSRLHLLENVVAIETIADWVLDTMRFLRAKLTKNEPILFVLDSLAALTTIELEGMPQTDKKSEMGIRARKIGDFLRERNMEFKKYGICVILINQLRKKVGASQWEDPDQTSGGQATKYYAAQRIGISKGKQIKTKIRGTEFKVGQNTYIRTRKDKTGPPRETTEAKVYFRKSSLGDIGFDKYAGLPELLVQKGVLERKKGSSRYYYDGAMVANGEDSLLEKLQADDSLRSKLIKKSGVNTISRTRNKIEALTKNLYPVKAGKVEEE
jgi:recombination protein RecA